tara:strand:- start:56 stop:271 length:216 start_codon:yes stop_codon:yes gene_type:complete
MAIDRTFDFGQAVAITHDMVDDLFKTHDNETLEEMNLPVSADRAIADILNGELDHVVLRRAIEKTLETTTV